MALSNILILITVALLKGKKSPNGLAHLISFMSWGIWISKDTRVNQKVISASLAISKPCGVEVKLQVKIVITNPLSHSHITESTQLFGTMENSPTEVSVESPTWTNTPGLEQSVEVITDAKTESGIVDGFPSMNISPGRDPYNVFTSLFSSHVFLEGLLPCSYRRLHSTMLMMKKYIPLNIWRI